MEFTDWLTELTVRLESDHGAGGGAGKAKIILMGHSMGGLLIADAAKGIVDNSRPADALWPKVVGILGTFLDEDKGRCLTV
jgi:alpha-beta hydrolase superfamily lysophospholipase